MADISQRGVEWPMHLAFEQVLATFSLRRQMLSAFAVPVEYQKNQIVFYQGHVLFGVFIFEQGEGELQKSGKTLGLLDLQMPIGLNWLHANQAYPATLVITEFAKGVFISRNDLLKIF